VEQKSSYWLRSDIIMHPMKELIKKVDLMRNEINYLKLDINKLIKLHKLPHVDISNKEILTLSKPLQETFFALNKLNGEGTATQVSHITKKRRATESRLLNELDTIGLVFSDRIGHKKYFFLKKKV